MNKLIKSLFSWGLHFGGQRRDNQSTKKLKYIARQVVLRSTEKTENREEGRGTQGKGSLGKTVLKM